MARIGLCGTHSTGKTTLAKALKEKLPHYYLDINITRWVRSLGFPINEESNDASQEINLVKRIAHLNSYEHIIADRTIIDNIAYSTAAYEKGNLSEESLNYQKGMLERNISKYDFLFYIPPEIPLELDGVRNPDDDYRMYIDRIVQEYISYHPYHIIIGSTEDRVSKIMEIMSELKSSKEQFT